MQPLIDQLSDTRVFVQEQAAAALAKLAYNNEATRAAITQVGGVEPLIALLQTQGDEASTVRQNGANALANLASDTAARDEIVGAGGIRPLVIVLDDEQNSTKKYAARALARLSTDRRHTERPSREAGAIQPARRRCSMATAAPRRRRRPRGRCTRSPITRATGWPSPTRAASPGSCSCSAATTPRRASTRRGPWCGCRSRTPTACSSSRSWSTCCRTRAQPRRSRRRRRWPTWRARARTTASRSSTPTASCRCWRCSSRRPPRPRRTRWARSPSSAATRRTSRARSPRRVASPSWWG